MNNNLLYNPKLHLVFRIFYFSAIVILSISTLDQIFQTGITETYENKVLFFKALVNILSVLCFLFVFAFPWKIEICAVISFMYSIFIFILEPENPMSVFMYLLSMEILYARGYFNKQRQIKKILSAIIFISAILSEMRFGFNAFADYFIEKLGYIFIGLLILFFFRAYLIDLFNTSSDCILDIKKYPGLKYRDAKWLYLIQKREKYETIAIEFHMSIGSVKNRLKIVFDILGIKDKQGFLNKYEEYKIIYGDKEIE